MTKWDDEDAPVKPFETLSVILTTKPSPTYPLSAVKNTSVLLMVPVLRRVSRMLPTVLSNSNRASPNGPLREAPAAPGPAYWG